MGIGVSLILIAVGAILTWAVNTEVSGVDIQTIGVILLIVGLAGGAIMILGSMLTLVDAVMEPRGGGRWIQPAFSIVGGAILLAYFIYLAWLKGKQKPSS